MFFKIATNSFIYFKSLILLHKFNKKILFMQIYGNFPAKKTGIVMSDRELVICGKDQAQSFKFAPHPE
jgi:hypothetical protein